MSRTLCRAISWDRAHFVAMSALGLTVRTYLLLAITSDQNYILETNVTGEHAWSHHEEASELHLPIAVIGRCMNRWRSITVESCRRRKR